VLVSDLPTPALLIERDRLDANLAAMQAHANAERVALRPHVKTHKTVELAWRQTKAGAQGLTVATVDEAEAFAQAGFRDLVVAREVVSEDGLRRLRWLAQNGTRLAFCVDTPEGVRRTAEAFEGMEAEVFVEVDTGHGRCGIPWDSEDAVGFVRRVRETAGLRLRGLLTHGGHSYLGPRMGETHEAALLRAMGEERDRLLDLAVRLGEAGMLDPASAVLSLGSTPTVSRFVNAERGGFRVTEVRPGNYVFLDAMQVALGVAAIERCALTAVATIVSCRRSAAGVERVFIDAGKKALSPDTGVGTDGFGVLLHSPVTMKPLPHARLGALSEEHGWITVPGGSTFTVGDRVHIVPNHACMAVASHPRLYLVDGEEVLEEWSVVAR